MNLFIAAAGLAADRLAALRAVGTDFEIEGTRGLVVEQADLPAGFTVTATSPSPFEGIAFATLEWAGLDDEFVEAEEPEAIVEVAKWDGAAQEKFCAIAKEILGPVRPRIVINVPHGTSTPPVTDGRFWVHVWSAAQGGTHRAKNSPEKIWGLRVDCRDAGFSALGDLTVESDGYTVAEIVGENLYVFHDAVHHGGEDELKIFKKILEEAVLLLASSPEERAEIRKKQAELRRVASRTLYVKECGRRFEKTVAGTREAVTRGHADVESLQQQLVRRIRETRGAERKLEQMLGTRGGEEAKYASEFDKLVATRKVRDVVAEGGVIKVFTDTLYCTDPRSGKRHEIGAFRIEIQTDRGDVRWFNLTRQVKGYKEGMQAPHVWSEGNACLGTAAEILPQLIGAYEFAAAAMVAIQFVESVNTDDRAGEHINRWPEAAAQV